MPRNDTVSENVVFDIRSRKQTANGYLLAKQSTVFAKLINTQQPTNKSIQLNNISVETFHVFRKFCYGESIYNSIKIENAFAFLLFAVCKNRFCQRALGWFEILLQT